MKKTFLLLLFAVLALGFLPVSVWAHDPCIDIEKLVSVDGGQTFVDADTCDEGPLTDGPAAYMLILKNCSDVPLTNGRLTDAALGIDIFYGPAVFPGGAEMVFTKADIPELEVDDVCEPGEDVFENVATVTANSTWDWRKVSDSDPACVKCEEEPRPCLELEKQVSVDGGVTFFDADQCSDADVPFTLDDSVYRLIATNCGDEELALTRIVDPDLGIDLILSPAVIIQPGQFYVFTNDAGQTKGLLEKEGVCPDPEGEFDNAATVFGRGLISFQFVEDTDTACVKCGPCIKIQKNVRDAENLDGDYQPANRCEDGILVPINNGAEYRIRVSNCGGELLRDVVINDPDLGISGFFVGDLAVDEAQTFFFDRIPELLQPELCRVISPELQFRNVAYVRGVGGFSGIQVVDQNPACVQCEECLLEVDKKCLVEQPPPGPFVCSDAKPIDSLTMIWNGQDGVTIKAWKGSVGSTLLETVAGVNNGDEVTITGLGGSPNDQYWEIFGSSGAKIGESTFHISCSDNDMNGPEDCGKPQGDGKDKAGYLNDWIFEGMAGKLALDCTPEPMEPTDECSFVLAPPPDCELLGKPDSLTFRYTGSDCSASSNNQGSKSSCSGFPGMEPVSISILSGKIAVSPMSGINIGDLVTVSETDKDMGSEIKLLVGGQELKIHTSCSAPLAVGDVFGSLELLQFNGLSSGANVTYFYEIKNIGDVPVFDVFVIDTPVPGEQFQVPGSPIAQIQPGESKTLEVVRAVSEDTINTVEVTGKTLGGAECSAEDSVAVTVEEPPAACTGATKVGGITFEYTGESCAAWDNDQGDKAECSGVPGPAPVSITIQKDPSKITVSPIGGINVGDLVTVSAIGYETGSEIQLYVGGQFLKIHTSCSQPLAEGDQFGSMRVVDLILVPKL